MRKVAILLIVTVLSFPSAFAAHAKPASNDATSQTTTQSSSQEPANSGKWREKSVYESVRSGWNTFLNFLVGPSDDKQSKSNTH